MMSNSNQNPHEKDIFIESRDFGAVEVQGKQGGIAFITDAPWKAELADECYELFLEKKILVFDEAKRELSYSYQGLKMLDEIQNTCVEGETYDFIKALAIATSYIGYLESVDNEAFQITGEGAKYAEGILDSLGVEIPAPKDESPAEPLSEPSISEK